MVLIYATIYKTIIWCANGVYFSARLQTSSTSRPAQYLRWLCVVVIWSRLTIFNHFIRQFFFSLNYFIRFSLYGFSVPHCITNDMYMGGKWEAIILCQLQAQINQIISDPMRGLSKTLALVISTRGKNSTGLRA